MAWVFRRPPHRIPAQRWVPTTAAAGGVTYEKTGALTASGLLSGADVFEHVEAGSLTPDTTLAGADVFTAAETGSLSAGLTGRCRCLHRGRARKPDRGSAALGSLGQGDRGVYEGRSACSRCSALRGGCIHGSGAGKPDSGYDPLRCRCLRARRDRKSHARHFTER